MAESIPPPGFTGASPSREQYLKSLASAIQRAMEDPTLAQSPLIQELKGVGRRVDLPLVVAVAGQFGVGKSAMLNAVFGAAGLIPEGAIPSPGCKLVIQYGASPAVEATYAGNQRHAFDPDEWANLDGYDALEGAERLDIQLPHDLLRQSVFVDTPGLWAEDPRDVKVTEDTLLGAEALVWVTSALRPLPEHEVDEIQRLCKQYRGRAVCVLVHVGDLMDPRREVPAAMEHIQRTLPGFFGAVAPIDSLAVVPEIARPTIEAIRRVIVTRREGIKVYAAGEAAKLVLARRRAAIEQETGGSAQKSGVTEARRRLETLVRGHQTEMSRAWERTKGALRKAEEDLVGNVLGHSREVVQQIPYQRKKVGLLQDEHFVEYEKVVTWEWPVERVEPAEKALRANGAKPLTAFADEVASSLERLMDAYADIVREVGKVSPDAAPLVDLLAGQNMLFAKYGEQLFRKLNAYFWGGIKCGGPRGLCAHMAQQRMTWRPDAKAVGAMVEEWVPLEKTRDLGDKYLKEYREALEERHGAWLNAVTAAVLVGGRNEIAASDTLSIVAQMLGG